MIDPIDNIPTQPLRTGVRYSEECTTDGWVVCITLLPQRTDEPDVAVLARDLSTARKQAKAQFEKENPGHTVLIAGLRY